MKHGSLVSLLTLATLFAAGGASCPRVLKQYTQPAPVVFEGRPTLERAMAVVNANTTKVQQLQTTGAKLSVPGVPSLRATMSFERPKRFRLVADTSLTGVELDLGSNDELFWMWVKRNDPPAIYFCRHNELVNSRIHQVMPIEPAWLAEALGLVYFDPRGRHEGPFSRADGQMEIRSLVPTGDTEVLKITVIDDAHGWVLQQHIYDQFGRRIASAVASQHRLDAANGVVLPRKVEVQLPTIEMAFTLEVSDYVVNSLSGDPATLWAMPRRSQATAINLGGSPMRRAPRAVPAADRQQSRLGTPSFGPGPQSPQRRQYEPAPGRSPREPHPPAGGRSHYNRPRQDARWPR